MFVGDDYLNALGATELNGTLRVVDGSWMNLDNDRYD